MIRRQVWEDVGGYDTQVSHRGYEDYEFWLGLAGNGYGAEFLPQFVGHRRAESAPRRQVDVETAPLMSELPRALPLAALGPELIRWARWTCLTRPSSVTIQEYEPSKPRCAPCSSGWASGRSLLKVLNRRLLQLERGENGDSQALRDENSQLHEQLDLLRGTKLFRWSSPARDVYSRLRRPR